MLNETFFSMMFLGAIFTITGLAVLGQTTYSVPAIPAGWAIGIVMTILGSSVDIASLLGITVVKKQIKIWSMASVAGTALLVMGIISIVNNPFELPPCPCLSGFYGPSCLPCPACDEDFSYGCDDGGGGSGECICNMGYSGPTCSVCAATFTGVYCEDCKRGWAGTQCNQCDVGYTGSNCNICDIGWIPETDYLGTLCRKCEPNRYGPYCKVCPDCTEYDSLAICKDNDYHEERVYDPDVCTPSAQICEDNFDCRSHNCRGQCVIGTITDGTLCASTEDCDEGFSCEFKSCCLEARYGDGTCDCGRNGYFGDTCEPCPGFDGIYSSSICGGHGTCSAVYVGAAEEKTYSHLKCECVPEGVEPYPAWTGETCGCLKETEDQDTCTECANGAYGPNCDSCPGGGGISQCNRHGRCSDGIDGDGTCTCDVDITFNGLGGWGGDSCAACHSGDFWGDRCETCPNIMMVGCHTSDFLATLPGSGNCISSCGPKTCNTDNGICV